MVIIAGLIGYANPKEKVKELLNKLKMNPHMNKSYWRLSGGQKRRISVAVAVLNRSRLLILDEPSAGIDPKARRDVWELLENAVNSGRSVILSSHSMDECEALCTRIGVLCHGRFIAIGDSQTLKSRRILSVVFQVLDAVEEKFPGSVLVTTQKDSKNLKWQIPKNSDDRLSALFGTAADIASSSPVEDFCLTQATLEDAFIKLNKEFGEQQDRLKRSDEVSSEISIEINLKGRKVSATT
ncbi:unnamed protein product [Nippostrongylus brasiliensis]|uniref:ATPase_AAA_core domain-containing protein n=1 Tax=Nippostrongylus brasiliensis TaxID=27835 RepID=A0A0N4YR69_NIPBR|nr:unnamed protein product [Nippostrongylus brasiliensis]